MKGKTMSLVIEQLGRAATRDQRFAILHEVATARFGDYSVAISMATTAMEIVDALEEVAKDLTTQNSAFSEAECMQRTNVASAVRDFILRMQG